MLIISLYLRNDLLQGATSACLRCDQSGRRSRLQGSGSFGSDEKTGTRCDVHKDPLLDADRIRQVRFPRCGHSGK